mgnify:FL=1
MLKRVLITFRTLILIPALLLWPLLSSYATESTELVFLTWSEYMDPELIKKFENKYNARIKFAYFESDELRDDVLINSNAAEFDIILSNGRSIKPYARRGWIMPISVKDVPNKNNIYPRWRDAFPFAKEYAVPFFWGTVGVAYRKDLVKQPITSWRQLLDPAPELSDKIVLVKDSRDLMSIALKSQGHSINTTDLEALDKAETQLQAQKPHVKSYSYIALTEESALVKGEAVAALAYNGDALMVSEHDENIIYVVPEEGTSIWVDYLTVSKATKNKKLAMDFINFLNEPENAAQLAQFVYFASPNRAAEKYLPKDFLENPMIYPDKRLMDKSEFYEELPPRIQKRYNTILPRLIDDIQ